MRFPTLILSILLVLFDFWRRTRRALHNRVNLSGMMHNVSDQGKHWYQLPIFRTRGHGLALSSALRDATQLKSLPPTGNVDFSDSELTPIPIPALTCLSTPPSIHQTHGARTSNSVCIILELNSDICTSQKVVSDSVARKRHPRSRRQPHRRTSATIKMRKN